MLKSAKHKLNIQKHKLGYTLHFSAMASPCEVIIESNDTSLVKRIAEQISAEAWRIEHKFSRYRDDNIIHRIHTANGKPIEVDTESAQLLDFAEQCYQLSDGLFDITSGVLRKAWKFDGSSVLPKQESISALLPYIGWQKLSWKNPVLTLPKGMQIDLGGFGKEYAVDQAASLAMSLTDAPMLINFGGDLFATQAPSSEKLWKIGIETINQQKQAIIEIESGGIATSGDARRFLLNNGKRYSHVLNPKTGWPIEHAPHSVTVASANCLHAGLMATLALLKGIDAEDFLQTQNLLFLIQT